MKFLALSLGFGALVSTRLGGRIEAEPELDSGTPVLPAGSES